MCKRQFLFVMFVVLALLNQSVWVLAQSDVMVTTTDNAQLRSGPGREHSSLGIVPYNTTLPAAGRNEDSSWVMVSYNGSTGWIAQFLLSWTGNLDTLPLGGVVPPSCATGPMFQRAVSRRPTQVC